MKSAELAALAGVSVRTLRHYHQLGILAEPGRQDNGYRRYNMRDLIRVLRIKNLSAAGIPLQETPAVLDRGGESGDTWPLLEAIDEELAQQIAHLTAQRVLIANARASNTAPDLPALPAELSHWLGVLAVSGSPEVVASSRDQLVLLAHLTGAEDLAKMAALLGRLSAPELWPGLLSISQQFEALTTASGPEEIAAVVDGYRDFFARASETFAGWTDTFSPGPRAGPLIEAYQRDLLNPAQRTVLARLGGVPVKGCSPPCPA